MPKFSIITINFNNCEGLRKTMQSVLAQNFSDYEYIIIDGGSTDGSAEIIEENKNKLSYWVSEKDSGIYNAMNKGIIKAKGDLIVFLNSGDYYISDNLLKYASTRIEIQKADIFFCRFIWDKPIDSVITLSDNMNTIYDWHLINSNFPHPATFYKKSIFSKIGLFDEDYKILADFEWNARALIKHRIPFQYINLITAFFRAEGISNSPSNKQAYDREMNKIIRTYFTPAWLYNYINNNKSKVYFPYLEKLLANIYRKKLNRV